MGLYKFTQAGVVLSKIPIDLVWSNQFRFLIDTFINAVPGNTKFEFRLLGYFIALAQDILQHKFAQSS